VSFFFNFFQCFPPYFIPWRIPLSFLYLRRILRNILSASASHNICPIFPVVSTPLVFPLPLTSPIFSVPSRSFLLPFPGFLRSSRFYLSPVFGFPSVFFLLGSRLSGNFLVSLPASRRKPHGFTFFVVHLPLKCLFFLFLA